MRTNESEYKRLEVAIYDLKAENAKLRKDKERLDWLLSKGLAWNGCYKGDWREGEWMYGNSTFNSDARNDIDKAMEEAQ